MNSNQRLSPYSDKVHGNNDSVHSSGEFDIRVTSRAIAALRRYDDDNMVIQRYSI